MKKRKVSLALKFLTISIIIFLALLFIIGYIWKVLKTADYFKIENIDTKETESLSLSYLKERNIFSIDLRSESMYLLDSCPDCSKVRLVRILPNRIFVKFIKRKPQAFVKLYRYFAVDEEGVLFNAPAQLEESELPVILGLETKLFGPKPGKRYNIKEIMLALDIIRETKLNKTLKDYKIKKIDLTNFADASFFISLPKQPADDSRGQSFGGPESFEVKISQDDIKDKIVILASLIIQVKNNLANIKYIDLRFREPVIKFKDVK